MKKYALLLLVVLAFHTVGWGSVVGLVSPGTNLMPNSSPLLRLSTNMHSTLPSSMRLNLYGGLNSHVTLGLSRMPSRYPTPIRSASLCRTPSSCLTVRPILRSMSNLNPAVLSRLGQDVSVDTSQVSYIGTPASNGGTGTVVWGTSNSSSSSSQSP